MTDKKQPFDVLVPEKYTHDGEDKIKFYRVGVAFEAEDGMDLILPEGISLSGRVHIRARKPKDATAG